MKSLMTRLHHKFISHKLLKHKWDPDNANDYIKISYLPRKPVSSTHYEVTYYLGKNEFDIALHWENKTGAKEFEEFIDQNKDTDYTKEKQVWQKDDYKGKGLVFYMLLSTKKIKKTNGYEGDLAELIKSTYNRFNPELVAFYNNKEHYKSFNTLVYNIKNYIDLTSQELDVLTDILLNLDPNTRGPYKCEDISKAIEHIKTNYPTKYADNEAHFEKLIKACENGNNKLEDTEDKDIMKTNSIPLNTILYGPPGTGKTYHTINKAVEIANENFYNENRDNREELKKKFNELLNNGQIVFTTFHQSLSYEDFIEGIKPKTVDEKDIIYKVEAGIFKRICEEAVQVKSFQVTIDGKQTELTKELFEKLYYDFSETLPDQKEETSNFKLQTIEGAEFELFKNSAKSVVVKAGERKANMSVSCNELINIYFENKEPTYKPYAFKIFDKILEDKEFIKTEQDNTNKNFVLIIDEINRGNIASIFGELITLIEPDKRKDADEELSVCLPYSKTEFSVPKNLFIIGTMNTADRSVEALDTALRRRFVFEEMPPKASLLDDNFYGLNLQDVLTAINKRIELLLDKDHKIGHSYFMNLKSTEDLQLAFKNKIIPLLEEYFYGDFAKIGLVLGEDFITINKSKSSIFKKIGDDAETDYSDFEEKIIYEIAVPELENGFIEAVQNIV